MAETAVYEALTKHLAKNNYVFVCPSPETQGRVVAKRKADAATELAQSAEDFFGWNLDCTRQTLASIIPDAIFESLHAASIITTTQNANANATYRTTIRVSNFYPPSVPTPESTPPPLYYIHSSYPATPDAVFFGPDTYLFTAFLGATAPHHPPAPRTVVDVCCGAGAGAIHMARAHPQADVVGLDLNARALGLGRVNAELAGARVTYVESDLYGGVGAAQRAAGVDLIVSNPPYIASSADGRDLPVYADGGAECGLDISLRIVEEGVRILGADGVIVVYTGVAIPAARPGYDAFLERLGRVAGAEVVLYSVLHPDMWPEEIGRGAYAEVGRIQAVGAVVRRKG